MEEKEVGKVNEPKHQDFQRLMDEMSELRSRIEALEAPCQFCKKTVREQVRPMHRCNRGAWTDRHFK